MPLFGTGLLPMAQNIVTRWEKAQAARYAAWAGAPSVTAGLTAVAGTVGSMAGGTGFAAVQRWGQGPVAGGLAFR